ncbi:site-specific integrase [Marixanthomonas ophiurae]|uniref:Site-specific integrase n=1 Tax=Marixanthomonas ophiurae TaxID=387659 RepID=A0A3E1QE98_9FLAO|nr:site-specific integrase [Marixanthomonas ophiurae]RFN60386.1 site-specific integrase [Marixanthomonas ophiurae]
MKVTLRERKKNGKIALYLDYYNKGKRKTEYLSLYLIQNPKTKNERTVNKKTRELAETIWAQRQVEIQQGQYGFNDIEKLKGSFTTYITALAEKKNTSSGNYGNWYSMLKHFKAYRPTDITFQDLDKEFVEGFKDYLDKKAIGRANKPLSQNSKYSYYGKFNAALKQAVADGILKSNPANGVSNFKQGEPQREFLTLEELQKAVNTECELPQLKKAFIFSALTGLRWSDIEKMKWSEIQHSKERGYYVRFRQKKTKGAETLPISDQAVELLGERGNDDDLVLPGLHYSAWTNLKLQQWMMNAGISKTITFHCARHTYATLQLTLGTDIYTVSKLLGHKELRTTQIYAKVIDDKKREASNRIKLDL